MFFYEYTYHVQDLKEILEEKKKAQENQNKETNKGVPNNMKNPQNYAKGFQQKMPKMPRKFY